MERRVCIRLLGDITVQAEDGEAVSLTARSRIGASLLEYLILQRGAPVPGGRLIRELWAGRTGKNPENALKTMVSRLRSMLHALSVGLGDCVACGAGGYYWQALRGVRVDVTELLECREKISRGMPDEEKRALLEAVTAAYGADLYHSGDIASGAALVSFIHKEYLEAVYRLVDLLRGEQAWEEIDRVCRRALAIDGRDERLRMEAMNALLRMDRIGEAAREYRRIAQQDGGDAEPSGPAWQASVRGMAETERKLQQGMDGVIRDLRAQDRERQGPFFCDYDTFREICDIQIRNLERLGSTLFLGVVTISAAGSGLSDVGRESGMAGLTEILRRSLRKGDTVTRVAPDVLALLLPTVSYRTGGMVLDRIAQQFYREFPAGGMTVHYRIAPLGAALGKA